MVAERLAGAAELAVVGEALDRGDPGAVGLDGEHRAALDGAPSTSTVQAPQLPVSQPMWVPVRPSSSRRKWMRSWRAGRRARRSPR